MMILCCQGGSWCSTRAEPREAPLGGGSDFTPVDDPSERFFGRARAALLVPGAAALFVREGPGGRDGRRAEVLL